MVIFFHASLSLYFAAAGVPATAAEAGNGLPTADQWSGFSKTQNCPCFTRIDHKNTLFWLASINYVTVSTQWTIIISDGLGADPSSDWNAPTELWGNYDEPKPATPAAKEKPVSEAPKVSQNILSTATVQ